MALSGDDIAVIAYEATRAYNHVIGDPWIDAGWPALADWNREMVRDGVRAALAGLSPQQMHVNWCRYLTSLGWVHGPAKDPFARPPTHPCLVPYDEVPAEHQMKDQIFRTLVLALAGIGEPGLRGLAGSEPARAGRECPAGRPVGGRLDRS